MRALITGGAGFIGSHLADALLARGIEVVALDDLSTGRKENLDKAQAYKTFTFQEGSTNDVDLLDRLVSEADVVYHLAASVGVKNIMGELVAGIENNIHGTENVLSVAAKYNKKVLLTSTSEVYGRSSERPFREDDDLKMGPTQKTRWSYACSKALDEYLGFAYWREQDLPVTVVRLFNTVGERQLAEWGMVLPTFIEQAKKNEDITIYGNGQQSRCFCHVTDVVGSLMALMEHPQTSGEIYNIGSDEEITIDGLADKVIKVLGSESKKKYINYEKAYRKGFDDIERRVPDTQKIKRLIDFKVTVGMEEIIRRMSADEKKVEKVRA